MAQEKWPKNTTEGMSLSREKIHELINSVLRKPKPKTIIDSLFNNPLSTPYIDVMGDESNETGGLTGLALMNQMGKYPEAFSRVNKIIGNTRENMLPGWGGVYNSFNNKMSLAPSWGESGSKNFTYPEMVTNINHELSHAAGLGDYGPSPNAYDIGNLTNILYEKYGKDVNLPLEEPLKTMNNKKLGIGPSSLPSPRVKR
jgi:hypothetical protein